MLNRLGKVRVMTGPTSPSEARLRRAQALALGNGTAEKIARDLISAKLTGQEMLVRDKLENVDAANSIAELEKRLAPSWQAGVVNYSALPTGTIHSITPWVIS